MVQCDVVTTVYDTRYLRCVGHYEFVSMAYLGYYLVNTMTVWYDKVVGHSGLYHCTAHQYIRMLNTSLYHPMFFPCNENDHSHIRFAR